MFALVVERWFPIPEKILATCICIFSNTIGISLGYLYTALFLADDKKVENFNEQFD